jgi:hypothetical protein
MRLYTLSWQIPLLPNQSPAQWGWNPKGARAQPHASIHLGCVHREPQTSSQKITKTLPHAAMRTACQSAAVQTLPHLLITVTLLFYPSDAGAPLALGRGTDISGIWQKHMHEFPRAHSW